MEWGKLVVSLIVLLEISFSAHMIPEVLLKISFLLPVANVQSYASNGEDWVRMLKMWSSESDGENFYSKPEFKLKIKGDNIFFCPFSDVHLST